MKTPYSWLKRYADIHIPADELAEKMVMRGNGVEEVIDLGADISGVVVGHVLEAKRHPNADTLWVMQVDAGQVAPIQIVTGADNVRAGDYVPVALHGSTLPGGKRIKKGKLRGEESGGMLCSGEELAISQGLYPYDEEGILILQQPYEPGADIKPILGLDDALIDFEVLPNRPDCQCVTGLAREAAVAGGRKFCMPEIVVEEAAGGDIGDHIRINVEDAALCPRYTARVVRNVKIEPSPLWMRALLNAAGVRPINNIVDITNFVMLELGQPMHAFDMRTIRGNQIIVRRAHEGEALTTLDGKERALTGSMLVIADAEGATGIAGVMGGEGSEIRGDTRDILFESACFSAPNIRVTSRALGLRTESSARFEKGVAELLCRQAVDRAAQLVEQLGAGEVVKGVIDVYPAPKQSAVVECDAQRIRALVGVDIPTERMVSILNSLDIQTEILPGDRLNCAVPPFRQDISGYADIAEEVLRIEGYDKIPSTLPTGVIAAGRNNARQRLYAFLRDQLSVLGVTEILNYSFMGAHELDALAAPPEDDMRRAVRLRNSLGEDQAYLRTTLLPAMFRTLALNIKRALPRGAFFEISTRFFANSQPDDADALPQERPTLSLGMYGERCDFYALKAIIDTLLARFGVQDARWSRVSTPYMHPGRCAAVTSGGEPLALAGEAHPDIAEAFGVATARAYVAEVYLDTLMERMAEPEYAPMPVRYPSVPRDIALVVGEAVPAGDVMLTIRACAGALCEDIALFDIYRGPSVKEGCKSLAFTVSLRSDKRTLTAEEANAVMEKCAAKCAEQYGAQLRA